MDLNSDRALFSNNPHNHHSKQNAFRNKLYDKSKSKSNKKGNKFYGNRRQIGKLKYIEKYAHKYLISFYKNTINDYNIRMIDDILNNESTHLVAEFKDYLIMGDITEFLHKSYKINEIRKFLPKICIYYDNCSFIFPNYVTLHESKYIYKNIRKKQKVIDNQQEQEEKNGKTKKGKLNLENSEIFFNTKTFNSILDQTNTSNVKLIFGINDNIDINETPNNIVDKLQKAENEANKRKINLMKNNKNKINVIIENEINNNYDRYDDNKSKKNNRIKSINGKSNIINNNNNSNYSGAKRRNNMKVNNYIDSYNDINSDKENDIQINNYTSMNPNINRKINNYNDIPKNYNYMKSNYNMQMDANKGINDKYNYNTFYANNTVQSKTQNIKKFSIENKKVKHHHKYFGNQNNYNKNLKKQVINSLFPSKSILTKVFINNFEDNNFIPSRTSINFLDKNKMIKNNINMNQMVRDSDIPTSPSSIQVNRNKYKESNSTKNINNAKLNDNIRAKQKTTIKRNNSSNHRIINYNNNTITSTSSKRTINKEEKTKNRQTHKNFSYNKALTINKNNENNEDISSYRTIRNNSPNYNRSINNINNININNINNYIVKNSNIQKINSSSNIQKSINMNMNININMNNNSYNKMYCNNCSSTNILRDKDYSKSPASNELETIKASKKKRTLYPKTKTFSELSNYNYKHQNIYNDCNSNIVKSINNNSISNENNYIVDSFTHTTHTLLNTNNINEDIYYNGGNNYINSKKKIFMEGLYRKNGIVFPFNREINNINININGYNPPIGCLTSRASNNGSKTKYKRNNDIQGTNLNSPRNKTSNINRSKINKKNNNLLSRNEVNPITIKNMYDSIQNNKFISNNRISGYLTSRIAKF